MRAPERERLLPIQPFHVGPTWRVLDDGSWDLPERTLGWWIIAWCNRNLQLDGEPLVLTDEQMRFLLWEYAIDEAGRWLFIDTVLQRMKGWGKDPLAAIMAAVEFIGPCRFSHFAEQEDVDHYARLGYTVHLGDPIATDERNAWVQIVATASDQTKNTAQLLPTIFTPECIATYGLDIGKERIYAFSGARRIEITSSAWRTMEGNRPTFVIRNETHHWRRANEGDELHGVVRRNLAKNPGGRARGISITNAYRPGEGSVAEMQRMKYSEAIELRGESKTLYDSLEAPEGTSLVPKFTRHEVDEFGTLWAITEYDDEDRPVDPTFDETRWWIIRVLTAIRGDATWLDPERLADEILTGEIPMEEALRFYYNSSATAEDVFIENVYIEAAFREELREKRGNLHSGDPLRLGWSVVSREDEIAVFGDGSKSNDATGLVGCRLSDGFLFTLGVWQRPAGSKKKTWTAPRDEIDSRVHEIFARFNVVGFWFDPSHTKDDEDGKGYWDASVDSWHQTYGDRLQAWGQQTGDRRSSVAWDMTSPQRQIDFVDAVARFSDEIESGLFQHDGHPWLMQHMRNARNHWTKAGWSISKASRGSKDKIDLCVCAIGARMLRRVLLNRGLEKKDQPAEVWFR
jgi:hypothetical protein